MPRGRNRLPFPSQRGNRCRTELFGHHPRLCLATRGPLRLAHSGSQRGGATTLTRRSAATICLLSASVRTLPPQGSPQHQRPLFHLSTPPSVRLMGTSALKHMLPTTHVRRAASTVSLASPALTRGQEACPSARGTAATLCQRCRAPQPEARPLRDRPGGMPASLRRPRAPASFFPAARYPALARVYSKVEEAITRT